MRRAVAVMAAGGPPEPKTQNEKIDEMSWVGRWATMWADFDKPVIGAIETGRPRGALRRGRRPATYGGECHPVGHRDLTK